MIRSLSLRSRCAAASSRASGVPALGLAVERLALVVLRLARLVDELARVDRLPLAAFPLAAFPLDALARVPPVFAREEPDRLEPVARDLEPEPREPPLLACGMSPPVIRLKKSRAPYLPARHHG
jgi:hypothetical protein